MGATAELPPPIAIPQSVLAPDLQVPSVYVDRFKAVTELTYGEDMSPPPHLIAAAVIGIDNPEFPNATLAERARSLTDADQYVRENPGAPFVHAGNGTLSAGIVGETEGLRVINWDSTIDYGTGLAILATASTEITFSGRPADSRILGVSTRAPIDEYVKFVTPDTVVTPESDSEEDLAKKIMEGGVLALGESIVDGLLSSIHNRRAWSLVWPIVDMAKN